MAIKSIVNIIETAYPTFITPKLSKIYTGTNTRHRNIITD